MNMFDKNFFPSPEKVIDLLLENVNAMNQFVPKKESSLRTTGHVSADGNQVVWNTPYAKAQFYGTNGRATFRKYSTPGTGKRWDLKAKPIFMNDWTKAFKGGADL